MASSVWKCVSSFCSHRGNYPQTSLFFFLSRLLCLALGVFLCAAPVLCHRQQPQSDPQALALATQSIAAMSGGVSISDATLTATGTWIVGSNTQTATVSLMAKGNYESRIDFQFPDGQQSEIRNNTGGSAQGEWLDASGNATPYSLQNCWTDPSWFFPVLSSLDMSDPTTILIYVDEEGYQNTSVYHLRSYNNPAGLNPQMTAFVNSVSTVDFYLDVHSLLLLQVTFNAHPDDSATSNIPVVITLANYTPVGGVQVPFRIRKTWNGNLLGDFTITSASFNTGLSDSLFSTQ